MLVFCYFPEFIKVITSCLSYLGGVFLFHCGGLSRLLYVSKAT
jgi:hypothetical protein